MLRFYPSHVCVPCTGLCVFAGRGVLIWLSRRRTWGLLVFTGWRTEEKTKHKFGWRRETWTNNNEPWHISISVKLILRHHFLPSFFPSFLSSKTDCQHYQKVSLSFQLTTKEEKKYPLPLLFLSDNKFKAWRCRRKTMAELNGIHLLKAQHTFKIVNTEQIVVFF